MSKEMILTEDDPRYKIQLDKYSFPFNWEDTPVDEWLHKLDPYEPFIHDIFLSCPGIESYFTPRISELSESYDDRCKQLLQILKDTKQYRSVITLNSNYSTLTRKEKNEIAYKTAEQVVKYDIYGCVISDFILAAKLHELCPDLALTTSCNYGQYSADQMIPWKKIGVNIINPCRSSGRNLTLLKQFKQQGFKLRVLLNEMCLLNCPYVNGGLCMSSRDDNMHCFASLYCNVYNTSFIIPRWLYILDDIVDIYKLTGRTRNKIDGAITQLKHYLLRTDDTTLDEVRGNNGQKVLLKDIPDLLMYCEQKCYGCTICDTLAEKYKTGIMDKITFTNVEEGTFAAIVNKDQDEFIERRKKAKTMKNNNQSSNNQNNNNQSNQNNNNDNKSNNSSSSNSSNSNNQSKQSNSSNAQNNNFSNQTKQNNNSNNIGFIN